MIGIPDMLVVLPGREAMMLEAKRDAFPVKLKHVTVTVTAQQWKHLRKSWEAGMVGNGVVSFIHRDDQFGIAILGMSYMQRFAHAVPIQLYNTGLMKDRDEIIWQTLEQHSAIFKDATRGRR